MIKTEFSSYPNAQATAVTASPKAIALKRVGRKAGYIHLLLEGAVVLPKLGNLRTP